MERLLSLVLSTGDEEASCEPRADAVKLDKVSVLEAAAQRLIALQQRGPLPSLSSASFSSHIATPALSSQRRQRSRFRTRKVACAACRARKCTCDGARPCSRCVKRGLEAHCTDRAPNSSQSGSGHNRAATLRDSDADMDVEPVLLPAADGDIVLAGRGGEDESLPVPSAGLPLPTWSSIGFASYSLSTSSLSSLPASTFSAFPAPASSRAYQSQLLMNIHVQRVPKHLTSIGAERKGSIRDKLVYWTWLHAMMTEQDVESVVHTALSAITHWHREIRGLDQHQSFIALSHVSGQRSSRNSSSTQHSLRPRRRCDGTFCGHFCTFFRALSASRPCRFNWLTSPEASIADSCDTPNHPFLVISHLHTDEESDRQNGELEQLGFRLAKQLVEMERAERGGHATPLGDHAIHDDVMGRARGASMDVAMSVRASASFERLLGYTQSEVRQWFAREGEAALLQLIRADGWARLLELDFDARWEGKSEYSLYVMCATKWKTPLPCLLHCTNSFGNDGNLSKRLISFIRLPVEREMDTE